MTTELKLERVLVDLSQKFDVDSESFVLLDGVGDQALERIIPHGDAPRRPDSSREHDADERVGGTRHISS